MSEAEEFLEQMKIVDGHIGYTVMFADAQKAVSLARKEITKEIFDWLDIELFKKNRIFVGEGQNVLAEGEKRFLEVKKK